MKNKGKHLFIDLKWRKPTGINSAGFIFHHVAEQQAKVNYRYFKKFKGYYINKNRNKKLISVKYYVRDLNLKYSVFMNRALNDFLIKEKILKKKTFEGVSFELVNIDRAMKVLTKDLKTNRRFFFKKKN